MAVNDVSQTSAKVGFDFNTLLDPNNKNTATDIVKEYGCNVAVGIYMMRAGIESHNKAEAKLEEVKSKQNTSQILADIIVAARKGDSNKVNELLGKPEVSKMGLSYDSNKVDDFVSSVSAQQSELNNRVNTLMTELQDASSKYSSMMSSSNAALKKADDLLSKLSNGF